VPISAKLRIWLLLLGVLVLAGCANPWPLRAPSETALAPATGRDHLAAGRYGLAIEVFRKAVKADPNSVAALNNLGVAYDHIGRYDLAAYYYERALTLDPDSAQTLNNFGFSLMLQGKFDLATVLLRDAQQRDQADPAIAANRAIAEAALRASLPRPRAQWQVPSDKDPSPLPRAWVERTTPITQTLITLPMLAFASASAAEGLTLDQPERRANADTLPNMLAAPIGDTRLSADTDRLPRPIAAAMADARIAGRPAITNRGEDDEPPG